MKYKDNYGVDSSTLEKGYSSTGNIPEDGESVNSSSMDEASEKPMLKMLGFPDETQVGFLERNNFSDRY